MLIEEKCMDDNFEKYSFLNTPPYEVCKEELLVTSDKAIFDIDVIHGYLSEAYWSEEIPREILTRAIANSLCFGLFEDGRQIGFARVITDMATYGYLADVFIVPSRQGGGLGTFLMDCIMKHPALQGFRRWMLATRDAHALYRKFDFKELAHPERMMEISRPGLYKGKK